MIEKAVRIALVLAAGALATRASVAFAWDAEAHRAIFDIALRLSPAAAARIPAEYRNELVRELREPDTRDTLCRYHRGPAARVDPFAEAERELAFLLRVDVPSKPYPRAKSIGRYLHWVADTVVPRSIAQGKVYEVLDFWANKDFIVYRERSALSAPLSQALRARAEQALWPDEGPSAQSSLLRLAVNTMIEAILLLPPPPGRAADPDDGPVLFIVNRIDTGLSGMRSNVYYYEMSYSAGGVSVGEAGFAEVRSGGQGEKKADLMQRMQVQIAEQAVRRSPDGSVSIRALVFNNLNMPACGVAIQSGDWRKTIDGTLPAGALHLLAFDVPPSVDARKLALAAATSGCPPGPAGGAVRTDNRIVLGSTGGVPRLTNEGTPAAMGGGSATSAGQPATLSAFAGTLSPKVPEASAASSGILSVELGHPAGTNKVKNLVVEAINVYPRGSEWRVRVTARNTGDAPPGQVLLVVAPPGEAARGVDARETVRVDMSGLKSGASHTFVTTHRAKTGDVPEGLRLLSVQTGS